MVLVRVYLLGQMCNIVELELLYLHSLTLID